MSRYANHSPELLDAEPLPGRGDLWAEVLRLRAALREADALLAVGRAGSKESADHALYGQAYAHLTTCTRQASDVIHKSLGS
jgi:Tfp pilus assembly ATPase PilU